MSLVDLIMPKLGEGIIEATILKWLKKPGDTVNQDEPLIEIATDKVDSEVPATVTGTLETIFFNETDVAPIGAVIATIRVESNAAVTHTSSPTQPKPQYEDANVVEDIPFQPKQTTQPNTSNKIRFYSPLVLNIASNEGISLAELENIPGTGQDGRLSKRDILDYVASKGNNKPPTSNIQHPTSNLQPQTSDIVHLTSNVQHPTSNIQHAPTIYTGNIEIIEMDRMRKLISKHMTDSLEISAHVTSFAECDVTNLVMWRERVKKDFLKRDGEKITFTPLFIEAVVKCIKKYPLLSSSVEGDKIIVKKDLNIGMATALSNGNLIVPVIKNADQLNLAGLTRQVNSLASAARNGKLKPDDTTGGTFTISNIGTFGSIMGTPIISQPQVAVMAMGVIKKRPVVVETAQGDSIAIRQIMYISLSYDHRIIDGALGSTFLHSVAKELENFDINRTI